MFANMSSTYMVSSGYSYSIIIIIIIIIIINCFHTVI